MPDRIKAEALRDTAIIEVMPHDGEFPRGKDELSGPVSRRAVPNDTDPVVHAPIISRK